VVTREDMTVTETEISLLHGLGLNESFPSSDYGSVAAVKQALLPKWSPGSRLTATQG
jgi:hypothetical protein